MRMVVVLPAPFGPKSPYTSPGDTTNDKRFTASDRASAAVKSLGELVDRDHTCLTIPMPGEAASAAGRCDDTIRHLQVVATALF